MKRPPNAPATSAAEKPKTPEFTPARTTQRIGQQTTTTRDQIADQFASGDTYDLAHTD